MPQTRRRSSRHSTGALDPPATAPARWPPWWLLVVLAGATLAAYAPAWNGSPVWDDDHHLIGPELASLGGLWRIWFDVHATYQYYPGTYSAFWLMHALWGNATPGYHLVNIGLHASLAFLFATLLQRLRIPGAALAAVIFALHPVHVESVAWMTELKNTLSGVCYLGAALAYLRFDETRRRGPYLAALALFLLAIACKSVTVTLPAAMLVIIWWRRGTVDVRRDVVPAAPLFVLAAAGAVMTSWVERTLVGAQGSDFHIDAVTRLLIACRGLWFYAAELVWPAHLMFTYPRWTFRADDVWPYGYVLLTAGVLGAAWWLRRRSRAPLAAVLLFGGTLFPTLGFVNVYYFHYSFVADHFNYLPSLSFVAAASAAIVTLATRRGVAATTAEWTAALVLGLPLGLITASESRQFTNAETLYRVTLERNPSSWMAHNNLGILLSKRHATPADATEGLDHLRSAIQLNPDDPEIHNNLANALRDQGDLPGAIAEYREALRLKPAYAAAHHNLGDTYQRLGRFQDALTEHAEALRIDPTAAATRASYAADLRALGQNDNALQQAEDALRARPNDAGANLIVGQSLEASGRLTEAIGRYRVAVQSDPSSAAAQDALGHALVGTGQIEEGVAKLHDALRLDPSYGPAHFHLANVLAASGHVDDAVPEYQAALKWADSADVQNNLGVAYARLGRTKEAVACFRAALALNPSLADAQNNLARALKVLNGGGKA